MTTKQLLFVAALAAGLAGCAGSVAAPDVVQPLGTQDRANLHLSGVSAVADTGVEMSNDELDVLAQKVTGYIQKDSPQLMASSDTADASKIVVHVTRFDRGNAFARAMLIGLGQIHIEGTVDVVDAAGAKRGEYKLAKDFALGGLAGAATTVDDVEDGFAKSVAAIVK